MPVPGVQAANVNVSSRFPAIRHTDSADAMLVSAEPVLVPDAAGLQGTAGLQEAVSPPAHCPPSHLWGSPAAPTGMIQIVVAPRASSDIV